MKSIKIKNHYTSPLLHLDLCVGAANLDDVVELRPLFVQGAAQLLEAGKQALLYLQSHGNVHGRGERVIGALAPIDMVVGMNWILGAQLPTQNLNSPIG